MKPLAWGSLDGPREDRGSPAKRMADERDKAAKAAIEESMQGLVTRLELVKSLLDDVHESGVDVWSTPGYTALIYTLEDAKAGLEKIREAHKRT